MVVLGDKEIGGSDFGAAGGLDDIDVVQLIYAQIIFEYIGNISTWLKAVDTAAGCEDGRKPHTVITDVGAHIGDNRIIRQQTLLQKYRVEYVECFSLPKSEDRMKIDRLIIVHAKTTERSKLDSVGGTRTIKSRKQRASNR